ncbi:MAG: thiamine pyrophosphate-dependent enzyme, partial [Candidatus Latescibacterota bacterium]|nr:thiamine pyrophosphate-dependent enzyme [Candidatus Latescibacterota bacterium]
MADVAAPLTRKDFVSDQDVRWCPGCGDYAILAQMQRVLPELGIPKEKMVFVSGIGCSSRFPYYMNTYGIHSIHGRAPTLATGLKVANPDLHVWVITGDGDGLSIGGNHLLHLLRRNVNLNIILFNNRIYGLTKGQYSPTSLPGHKTKSSPMGSIEQSFNPTSVAIAAEATFVARTADRNTKHLAEILRRAAEHKGTSFVEIYQNCNIFNDGAWLHVTEAETKDNNTLILEDGQPMIFGKDKNKGIHLNGLVPEVVSLGNGVTEADLLIHDETYESPALAYLLSRLEYPAHPLPFGVFRRIERPTYEEQLMAQGKQAIEDRGPRDLAKLFHSGDTWIVPEDSGWKPEDLRGLPSEPSPSQPDLAPGIDSEEAEQDDLTDLMLNPISELDLPDPHTVTPDTTLDIAVDTMQEKNLGCLVVTGDDDRLAGIFAQ